MHKAKLELRQKIICATFVQLFAEKGKKKVANHR